jgi:hypothetical protein
MNPSINPHGRGAVEVPVVPAVRGIGVPVPAPAAQPRVEEPGDGPSGEAGCGAPYNEAVAKALLVQLVCKYEEYGDYIVDRFWQLAGDGHGYTLPEIERTIHEEMRLRDPQIRAERAAREAALRDPETRGQVQPMTGYERRLVGKIEEGEAIQRETDDIDAEIARINAATEASKKKAECGLSSFLKFWKR